MFRSLAKYLGYERDEMRLPLYGLTEGQVARLGAWWGDDEGREVFLEALDVVAKLYGETLLSSRDDAAVHEARGFILGLRKAPALVDEILKANVRSADAERVRDAVSRDAADARVQSTYGSPAWKR
jgi:hypothetical protein